MSTKQDLVPAGSDRFRFTGSGRFPFGGSAPPKGGAGTGTTKTGNRSGPEPVAGTTSGVGYSLRPYQVDCCAAVEAAWSAGDQAVLAVLATGLGKTVLAAELIRRFLAGQIPPACGGGQAALFLAHRDELLTQTLNKLQLAGIVGEREQASRRASLGAPVVVASVQSLQRARLERFSPSHFGLVVVDEAHHSAARSYVAIRQRFSHALVLGLTATADRADGKALGEHFARVAFQLDIRDGIAQRWLAPIARKSITVDAIKLDGVKKVAGDFAQGELSSVMTSDAAIHGVCTPLVEQAGDRRTIVFCASVQQAHETARVLREAHGKRAIAVDGSADTDERRYAVESFARGDVQFLANCALFTEGFDDPGIRCVAVARPTLSRALYVQMVGRGTRLLGRSLEESIANGKSDVLVLDFAGTSRHQLVSMVDALAGSAAAAVREEMKRLLDAGETDVQKALAVAEANIAARPAVTPAVVYRSSQLDPILGQWLEPTVGGTRPLEASTLAQLEKEMGISKPPPGITEEEARRWLVAHRKRKSAGLCSMKQMRALGRAGIPEARLRTMTMERASELVLMLIGQSWRPSAIAHVEEMKVIR